MHRRVVAVSFMLVAVVAFVCALDTAAIEEADSLYDDDQSEAALEILEGVLPTAANDTERAEVYWRLSRATLDVGEKMEDRNVAVDEVLAVYEEGEAYGIKAVEADPRNHLGYYWQSANIGKWGQAKGILNALFKAGPMRDLLRQAINVAPDHAGSFYVLGQLYAEVPGVISFGNDDFAVSLARKSIDLHEAEFGSGETDEIEYDYYIQLASHLIQRNWDARKRVREQDRKERNFGNTSDQLERGWYYEGMVDIPEQSDREEAEDLLRRMIGLLEVKSDRSDGQNRQLDDARELLAGL